MRKWITIVEDNNPTLYHGTLRELIPQIEQDGIVPRVGDLVTAMYGDDDYGELEPLVFAASKTDIKKCISAISWLLRGKKIEPTMNNIIKYGAIVVFRNPDGFEHVDDEAVYYGNHPQQAEPGDYYSPDEQIPSYILVGKRLKHLLRRHGLLPRLNNSDEGTS